MNRDEINRNGKQRLCTKTVRKKRNKNRNKTNTERPTYRGKRNRKQFSPYFCDL